MLLKSDHTKIVLVLYWPSTSWLIWHWGGRLSTSWLKTGVGWFLSCPLLIWILPWLPSVYSKHGNFWSTVDWSLVMDNMKSVQLADGIFTQHRVVLNFYTTQGGFKFLHNRVVFNFYTTQGGLRFVGLKKDDLKPGQLVDGDQTNLKHTWSPFSQLSSHSFSIFASINCTTGAEISSLWWCYVFSSSKSRCV